MLMRLTRVRVPSVRASPAAGKAAETLTSSPWLKASVACRIAPMQTPPEHKSPAVAALSSLQGAALTGCSQPMGGGELMSVVQRLPSSQGGRLVVVLLVEVDEVVVLVVERLVEVDELVERVVERRVEVDELVLLVVELLVEVDEVELLVVELLVEVDELEVLVEGLLVEVDELEVLVEELLVEVDELVELVVELLVEVD